MIFALNSRFLVISCVTATTLSLQLIHINQAAIASSCSKLTGRAFSECWEDFLSENNVSNPASSEENASNPASSEENYIRNRVEQNKKQEETNYEQNRLKAIAGWRVFGRYAYNWNNWKLAANGTRTTQRAYKSSMPRKRGIGGLQPPPPLSINGILFLIIISAPFLVTP